MDLQTLFEIADGLQIHIDQLKRLIAEKGFELGGRRPNNLKRRPLHRENQLDLDKNRHLSKLFSDQKECLVLLSTLDEGMIIGANKFFFEFLEYREEEVLGKTSIQLGFWENDKERQKFFKKLHKDELVTIFPCKVRKKTGEIRRLFSFVTRLTAIEMDKYLLLSVIGKDMPTDLKQTLFDGNGGFFNHCRRADEIRTAFKDFKDYQNQKDVDLRERIGNGLKKNILPFVEKLKKEKLDQNARTYLTIIETGLNTLVSSFPHIDSLGGYGLTSTEIQVAELVVQGKTSKEIALLLHVSKASISFHRNNIRKKMGLHKKKTGLLNYLNSKLSQK